MDSYRYLILTEGHLGPHTSKTANSAIRYLPERVAGVLDSLHAGRTTQEVIGLGGALPVVVERVRQSGRGVGKSRETRRGRARLHARDRAR